MTKQDRPMPPDERLRVVANLRKFMGDNKEWNLGDVQRETGVHAQTMTGWLLGRRSKPRPGANIEALAEFLKRRGYHA